MTAWLGHGPLGPPGAGYGYGGLVLGPFNVHGPSIRATGPLPTRTSPKLHTLHCPREADARRKENLRQLKSGRVPVIDLVSREARRQEALAQLAAGTADFMV